jgi:hypothetical protein
LQIMATDESTRAAPPRKPGTLEEELLGLAPTGARVRELDDIGAVALAFAADDGEVELVMAPGAAVEMALRLTSAAVRVALREGLS